MTLSTRLAVLLLLLGLLPAAKANTDASVTALLQPPVVSQLDWVLSFLNQNNDTSVDEAAYEERFAAPFRAQVPLDVLLQISMEYQNKSWSVHSATPYLNGGIMILQSQLDLTEGIVLYLDVVPESDNATTDTTNTTDTTGTNTTTTTSPDESGKIASLVVAPYAPPTLPPDNPPQSIDEAAEQLQQLIRNTGSNFHYIVADINNNDDTTNTDVCHTIYSTNETLPMPLGSMFKLYVLAAVLDAIDDGRISSWTQPVVIDPQYFSLPTGIVQGDSPGSTRTVRELATLMMAISDNTATDHLMGLVGGRSAVEQAMLDYNYNRHNPSLSQPFLFTRELFLLKLLGKTTLDGMPGRIGRSYQQTTSVQERRQILDDQLGNITIDALDLAQVLPLWSFPVAVDTIEWFASPLDLCRVLYRLQQDTTAREILARNNGVVDPLGFELLSDNLYSYIGFKGGSEPGVLGLAWYVESGPASDDNNQNINNSNTTGRVVAGGLWNTDRVLTDQESAQMTLLMGHIRDMAVNTETSINPSDDSDIDDTHQQATMEPSTSSPPTVDEESDDPSSAAFATESMHRLTFMMALLGNWWIPFVLV